MYSSLMGPKQPALEECGNSIRQRQKVIADIGILTDNRVGIALGSQRRIPAPTIGAYCATWLNAFFHSGDQAISRCISYSAQANAARPVAFILNRNHNQRLASRSAPPLAWFFSTDVGFIHFNSSRQTVSARSYHGSSQLMQPCPSRMIAAEAQYPLQPEGTDTVLLAHHVPDRAEPQFQWLLGILKYRTGGNRGLKSAVGTFIQISIQGPSFMSSAARTPEAIWPTQLGQIFPTSLLGGKAFLKLQYGLGIVLHKEVYYIWWLPDTSA